MYLKKQNVRFTPVHTRNPPHPTQGCHEEAKATPGHSTCCWDGELGQRGDDVNIRPQQLDLLIKTRGVDFSYIHVAYLP